MVAADPVADGVLEPVAAPDAPDAAFTAESSDPCSKVALLGSPEIVDSEGRGCEAALRTETVHLCVWSGGAESFSAGVSGVDVDPYRIGLWMERPLTRLFDILNRDGL